MNPPLRVLILEDNPHDAELLLRELRRGFELEWTHVDNEQDFLTALASEPEIILSDYHLPFFDAPRALELVKESGHDIPFIIVSGAVGEDLAVESMKRGAVDYLLKDRLARLNHSITQALEQAGMKREQKRMQEEVRRGEERFLEVAENILEVFWSTDAQLSRILYVSPAYETIWGRSCTSLYEAPRSWQDCIHPDDKQRVQHAQLTKQVAGTYDEEYRIIRPDGALRWIRDRAFPVRDAEGEVYRVVGVAQDITEQKLAHDRLREQAALLDKAQDAILVRDLDNRVTYWNEGATRLYGWTAAEAVGKEIVELICRDVSLSREAFAAVLDKGEWSGELPHLTKSGQRVLVESRWTLVRDAAGRPQSILSINTDVTEKRRLEQQFLRAQRLENIGTLASGIAHDLNNVLSPILMSIDLLRLTSKDSRAQSMFATIESSARRGADMVRQILTFARGVEGQRALIDLRHIIRDIRHLAEETFPKSIECVTDMASSPCLITGDHTQVHQVLLNLCVNARDAMPSGGRLTISAAATQVDDFTAAAYGGKTGPHILLQVADTGTGMPHEVIERIFDPFFTTKEVGKGTGLGLSTVLTIVKSHGGMLHVQSQPDEGTTFSIYLPADSSSEAATATNDQPPLPHGKDELLLVIDDEQAVRTITQQTLEVFGYRVLLAADGAQALSIYAQHQAEVAAVITDLMMPVMSGEATIEVLRRLNPGVKIIAGTGVATTDVTEHLTKLGVKHILAKPYTTETMLKALRQVIG